MKDYAAMSDFEINEAVGKFVYLPYLCVSNGVCLYAKDDIWTEFDPCNNPADAWPIIEGSYISIQFYQGNWMASVSPSHGNGFHSACFIGKAPLRAGMIVFLMMKEGE